MFPFNQSHDLVFQIHPSHHQQQQLDHQKVDPTSLDGFVLPTTTLNSRRKKSILNKSSENKYGESGNCDDKQRKVMHREIERLRRLEMGKLYESLRSLLPLDFIKGKRSISDHMNESVNYINYLQGSIKELELKKNKLKKMCDKSRHTGTVVVPSTNYCLRNNNYNNIVQVAPCFGGVEILINSGVMEEGLLPLSRVMEVIILEGLSVISCASVKINGRFLHTIQSEVCDGTRNINIPAVEQKLNDIIFVG